MTPPVPVNERARISALRSYHILDTEPEQAYDDFALLASQICGTPVALISLVDQDRQWFKSRVGWATHSTPRDVAFCAHAICERDLFMVSDTSLDERFALNPLVTGDPGIRFYAGTPLVTPDGLALGTLCVVDRVPRALSDEQKASLSALGRQVVAQLELRRLGIELTQSVEQQQRVFRMLGDVGHDLRNLLAPAPLALYSLRELLEQAGGNLEPHLAKLGHSDAAAAGVRAHITDLTEKCLRIVKLLEDCEGQTEVHVDNLGDIAKGIVIPPRFELTDFAAVFAQVTQTLAPLLLDRRVGLEADFPAEGMQWSFDRRRLTSILYNLLHNAVAATAAGGKVTVRVGPSEPGELPVASVTIEVCDTGAGMPPEVLRDLFTDEVQTTKPGGSGLGTRIVRDAVAVHGGTVSAQSRLGVGTTVSILLPADPIATTA